MIVHIKIKLESINWTPCPCTLDVLPVVLPHLVLKLSLETRSPSVGCSGCTRLNSLTLLRFLHRLPTTDHVANEVNCLCYKCFHNCASDYHSSCLTVQTPSRGGCCTTPLSPLPSVKAVSSGNDSHLSNDFKHFLAPSIVLWDLSTSLFSN